ncbi:hypothetical protein VTJ04DRAFT_4668 [Mycothermus thermophilus]|uniref:uncharacterized protein n=1 Tax=Humicola insolens TaxID=85995 RepID=UPI0037430691
MPNRQSQSLFLLKNNQTPAETTIVPACRTRIRSECLFCAPAPLKTPSQYACCPMLNNAAAEEWMDGVLRGLCPRVTHVGRLKLDEFLAMQNVLKENIWLQLNILRPELNGPGESS